MVSCQSFVLGASGNEGEHDGSLWHGAVSASSIIMALPFLAVLFVMLVGMMDKLGSAGVKQVQEGQS